MMLRFVKTTVNGQQSTDFGEGIEHWIVSVFFV